MIRDMKKHKMVERFFPIMIMSFQILASTIYFVKGDWKNGIIWIAAALMNFGIISK